MINGQYVHSQPVARHPALDAGSEKNRIDPASCAG